MPGDDDMENWYTLKEAAMKLGVDWRTLRTAIENDKLTSIRVVQVGRQYRLRKKDVDGAGAGNV